MIMRCMQGPAAAVGDKERGAGDWQLYQSPAAVLKEVAARNAQARLPGPPARPQARSFIATLSDDGTSALMRRRLWMGIDDDRIQK